MKKLISFIFTFTVLLSFAGCGQKAVAEWEQQYNLGIKFVNEANYEEAVLAFTKSLEIDPKQTNVYISLAETYIRQGDFFTAQTILDKAQIETGTSDSLTEALKMLKQAQTSEFPAERPVAVRRERHEYNDEYYHMYSYDENDNVIRAEVYTVAGDAMESDELYFFDENNNMIRVYTYTPDGQLQRYTICKYWENTRTGYDYYYSAEEELLHFVIYTLTEDGSLESWKQYYPDGTLMEER